MRLAAPLALVFLLVGCAAPLPQAEPGSDEAGSDTLEVEAPLWSRQGVEAQPRMDLYRHQLPPELGFEPGSTPWRTATMDVPEALREPGPDAPTTPGSLLVEWIATLDAAVHLGTELWEQTTRVYREAEDRAVGVVLQWGFKDDSVIGHDLRVSMRQRDGAWTVEQVEERYHCARAVTEEGLCL